MLNQDIITKIIPTLDLKEDEKNKLLNSLSKIFKYFNYKKENRQTIKDINGKILMNKQIIEEIKRRKDENLFFYKDQINNMEASVNKKGGGVKQFQKNLLKLKYLFKENVKPPKTWKNMENGNHLL